MSLKKKLFKQSIAEGLLFGSLLSIYFNRDFPVMIYQIMVYLIFNFEFILFFQIINNIIFTCLGNFSAFIDFSKINLSCLICSDNLLVIISFEWLFSAKPFSKRVKYVSSKDVICILTECRK